MQQFRRDLLKYLSGGSASIMLKSAVTGIPAAALTSMQIPNAFAQDAVGDALKPQYLVLSTRGQGDPFNVNCPGVYDTGVSTVFNNPDPKLAPTNVSLDGKTYRASKPWATLPQWALNRTAFINHRTYQGIHSQFGAVMELMGSSRGPNGEQNFPDHLSSIITHSLAESNRLNTVQNRPIRFGGDSVKYQSQSVQKLTPVALKSLFDSPTGVDKQLQNLRDKTVNAFSQMLKGSGNNAASPAQQRWLEQQLRSKNELRQLNDEVLKQLNEVNGGDLRSQMDSALLCFKLNLSAVATIGIPFGGDNHNDEGWEKEVGETISGCGHMKYFFDQLKANNMENQVTLANLNVFGRTFHKIRTGRSHNSEHHMMAITGPNVKAGVYGGLMQIGRGAGASGIQSDTGEGTNSGDIPATQTLEAAAKTLAYAVGVPTSVIEKRIRTRNEDGNDKRVGKVITAAIKS